MSNTITYQVDLKLEGDSIVGTITKNIEKMTESTFVFEKRKFFSMVKFFDCTA